MKVPVKTVLLTGGSGGIGAATARLLAESGMTVYAASRSGKAPEASSGEGVIVPVVMDVNDEAAIASAAKQEKKATRRSRAKKAAPAAEAPAAEAPAAEEPAAEAPAAE